MRRVTTIIGLVYALALQGAPAPDCHCPGTSTQVKKNGKTTYCLKPGGYAIDKLDLSDNVWNCNCPTWAMRLQNIDGSVECVGSQSVLRAKDLGKFPRNHN